jgi:transmembrane sensor
MESAQDPASQDAARWYSRLRAPDFTAAERADFEQWLGRDARNAVAYAAAERMADALGKLAMADPRLKAMVDQAASAGATLPEDPPEEHPRKSPPLAITAATSPAPGARRRVARPFAWAASIAVAVVSVAGMLMLRDARPGIEESYRYADGRPALRYSSGASRRAVTLDDGTRVYLDVASIIEVRFDSMRRGVTLLQGRALFDAAHDSARPFVVAVGTDRVTALGALFQVDREPAENVVTLAYGAVTVTSQSGTAAIKLAPGEELRSSAGSTRWRKRTIDAESATSWSIGRHVFHERPLAEAVREINRYAEKKVRLADERLAMLVVNGEFATGNSSSIIDALAESLPLRVSATPTELVLSSAEAADRAQF